MWLAAPAGGSAFRPARLLAAGIPPAHGCRGRGRARCRPAPHAWSGSRRREPWPAPRRNSAAFIEAVTEAKTPTPAIAIAVVIMPASPRADRIGVPMGREMAGGVIDGELRRGSVGGGKRCGRQACDRRARTGRYGWTWISPVGVLVVQTWIGLTIGRDRSSSRPPRSRNRAFRDGDHRQRSRGGDARRISVACRAPPCGLRSREL